MSSYRGHVENGVVKLDEPAALPEGAAVRIEMIPPSPSDSQSTWREKLERLAGGWKDDRSAEEIIADIRAARRWTRSAPELD